MTTGDDLQIIIPARLGGRRFPGKPLTMIGGKSLIAHTYERASMAGPAIVALCDHNMVEHCTRLGIPWRFTPPELPTGAHRCARLMAMMNHRAKIVINWQCDELLLSAEAVGMLVDMVRASGQIATLVAPLPLEAVNDPNVVKAAVSADDRCLWFSRASMAGTVGHCGVYAFPREALQRLGNLPETVLSRAESLEQLAWLEFGFEVRAVPMAELPPAVNVPADVQRVEQWIRERGEK